MYKIFTLCFLFLSTSGFSQADYSIRAIPLELTKNANSVLLDELIEVDISEIGKVKYSSKSAVTVLNKKGDRNAYARIGYDPDIKIKSAEVYIYDKNGSEIKHFKKRDFGDISAADGFSLYQDNRLLYLNYKPSAYPYTFVFNYETESSSNAFIQSWFPSKSYSTSIKKSKYKLTFADSNKPRYKTKNLEGFDISVEETPTEYVFTATNLKAMLYEGNSLSFREIASSVYFAVDNFRLNGVAGNAKNWKDFGNWMQNSLLSDVDELPEGTVKMIQNLVQNETTNLGKARKVYQYLQDKVRYISIQIGIGGWKPMMASDVDKLGYGDCKALSNYTKALLDAVGVPSYYTVLYAGDEERDILNDFSSIQGNHVILGVPDGDDIIWLECTSQNAPFGFNGNFSDDRDVLIITPEGGKIVHTKKYSFDESLQENVGTLVLDETGAIRANFEVMSKGLQYDDKYYLEKETKDDLIESYVERWSYINGLNVEGAAIVNDKANIVFTEKLSVKASNYATKINDDLLFCVNVFNQSQYIPSRITNRKQDLHLSYGFKDHDRLRIIIPDNYRIDSLPEDTIIENKFGSYSISFSEVSKNKIEYTRSLIIRKGTFPPEEYDNYRSFRRKVAKLDKTKIVLKKTP